MSALSYLSWPTLGVSKHIQISQERKMKGNYLHLKVPIAPQFWEAKWTPPQSCALHLLLKRTACLVPSDGLWLRTCRWPMKDDKLQKLQLWHAGISEWWCETFWICGDDSNDNAKKRTSVILQLPVNHYHDAIWHHFEIEDLWDCSPCLKTTCLHPFWGRVRLDTGYTIDLVIVLPTSCCSDLPL